MARLNRTPHRLKVGRVANPCWRGLRLSLATLGLWAGCAVVLPASEPATTTSGQIVADISTLLAGLATTAQSLRIEAGELQVPPGGHLQGIQWFFDEATPDRRSVVLSHDSLSEAYLVVAQFPSDLSRAGRVTHVQRLPSDGQLPPLRHAGGMQLAGQVLAVGVEDNQQKSRSEIQFWDFSKPRQPTQFRHLTIKRRGSAPKDMTAGAVGLVRRQQGFLLAVANWDSRAIDFYVSNDRPLADASCRFGFHSRWEDARADKNEWQGGARFGTYQAANLVLDAAGRTALVGFDTTSAGDDLVDVFSIDMQQATTHRLRKLASKTVRLAAGNHFRYAAGIAIDDRQASLLASPRALEAKTTLSIVPPQSNAKSVEPAGQPE